MTSKPRTTPATTTAAQRHKQALRLRAAYDAGATVAELASDSGLPYGTVINRLRAAGTVMRTPQQTRRLRADPQRRRLAADLRARYEDGATVATLVKIAGRSARTVRRLLHEAGATLRPARRRQLPAPEAAAAREQLKRDLRANYDAGDSIQVLAQATRLSTRTVHRLLREAGTTMRSPSQHSRARRAELSL
ncbi:helix-turn-helix domain-containing protein [Kitasatospora sp. NPDC052896]|uniref:helix-turn-helix domain-containing protein n=1 Tax=Kitasatospora sp. NPDC052896 TaxID=3364061 RepID=UPI0037CAB7F0